MKSAILAGLLCLLACGGVFVRQSARITDLRGEIAEYRVQISEPSPITLQSTARAESLPQVRELLAPLSELSPESLRSPLDWVMRHPKLFEAFAGLTLNQALTLAGEIEAPISFAHGSEAPPTAQAFAKMILVLFAMERNAEAVYQRFPEVANDSELRASLVVAWLKQDPEQALAMLEPMEVPRSEQQWFKARHALEIARDDFPAGFAQLLEIGDELPFRDQTGTAVFPVAVDLASSLLEAAADLDNAPARARVAKLVLRSLVAKQGVATARVHAEAVGLTTEILDGFFHESDVLGAGSDPVAYLDWMRTAASPEIRKLAIPQTIIRWAARDYNAAAEWLGTMEPSLTRDEAVFAFAQSINRIDPKASVTWAQTITDENIRRHAVSGMAGEWLRREPEQAQTWLDAQSINASPTHETR